MTTRPTGADRLDEQEQPIVGPGEAQAAAWVKSVLENNTTPDTVSVVEDDTK